MKEPKSCAVCGRTIEWRRKWEKNWDEVKYCGEKCRRSKGDLKGEGARFEATILKILATRPRDKTMCPSEVLEGEEKQDKELMERVREAARRLVEKGKIEIVQGGKPVDPSAFKGPIRLRLR